MPFCPACHSEQTKRKNGACPKCGALVDIYKGHWFRHLPTSPTVSILRHFEERVSQALSARSTASVVFTIPRKGLRYKRELVVCERLLQTTDFDYSLVIETLDHLFIDKRFNWKLRDTLLWIEKDFNTALAIVKAEREAQKRKEHRTQEALANVLSRENVFS
jgi:hypothetical protein